VELTQERNNDKTKSNKKSGITNWSNRFDEEEEKKRLARLQRWNPDEIQRIQETDKEAEKRLKRAERFGSAIQGATVEWTKFETTILKKYKLEPSQLFESDEQRLSQNDCPNPCERLHLRVLPNFAANFKLLKTWDIQHRFQRASYIEWLGDESCNVWFSEIAEAERALLSETIPIQSPPPGLGLSALSSYWRLLVPPLTKSKNDAWGKKDEHQTFLLCRFATADDVLKTKPKHAHLPGKRRRDEKRIARTSKTKYIPMDTSVDNITTAPESAPSQQEEQYLSNNTQSMPPQQDIEDDDEDNLRANKRRKFTALTIEESTQPTLQGDANGALPAVPEQNVPVSDIPSKVIIKANLIDDDDNEILMQS